MKTTLLVIALTVASILFAISTESPVMTTKMKAAVVESLDNAISTNYYFTDRIDRITSTYKKHLGSGDYKDITNPNEFAERLTMDFQEMNKDLHFHVTYNGSDGNKIFMPSCNPSAKSSCNINDIEQERKNNFGFKKVEILPGNVGYIKLDHFSVLNEAYQTAASAMDFVSNTNALIFDLRNNNGGSAALVQYLSTYLFDEAKPTILLNSVDMRGNKIPIQTWTLTHTPGKRMADIPIYILTSKLTGSAPEAFAFSMKTLQRATIVGETTAGAAHPVTFADLGNGFFATIPIGKISNPLTGTDWESSGVEPDVSVESKLALDTAYKMTLDSLALQTTDPTAKFTLDWALDGLNMKTNSFDLNIRELPQYVGKYGQRTISMVGDRLFYKRLAGELQMIPMGRDKFAIDGMDNFRIRFERDNEGTIVNLVGMYEEGREDSTPRTQ